MKPGAPQIMAPQIICLKMLASENGSSDEDNYIMSFQMPPVIASDEEPQMRLLR